MSIDSRLDRVAGLIEEARDIVDEIRADDSVPIVPKIGADGVRKSLRDADFYLTDVRRHLNEAHRRAESTIKDIHDRHA
jgi:hypothetical protein